jgi:hypothetical protein
VLLVTSNWAGRDIGYACTAIPVFSAQPQAWSTHFLTSAHCFTDIVKDGAVFAKATTLYYNGTHSRSCSLVHHFFCHPSARAACSDAAPSMDLAIVRCAKPLPAPSTRLSALPQQSFQRAFIYGFSAGFNLDPHLMYHYTDAPGGTALHLKFVRLAPSIQYPGALNINYTTLQLLSSTAAASAGAGSEGAALPLASYQGYLDTVPEQGMSGGAVVDLHCGLLGIIKGKSPRGVGGELVRLSQPVVDRVLEARLLGEDLRAIAAGQAAQREVFTKSRRPLQTLGAGFGWACGYRLWRVWRA